MINKNFIRRFTFPGMLHAAAFLISMALVIQLSSCLKNKDDFEHGPKVEMVIANYVVNSNSLDFTYDNAAFPNSPVAFGTATGNAAGLYSRVPAGTHAFRVATSTGTIMENLLPLNAGNKYSLFVFDSMKNNQVKTMLLKDVYLPADTIAKCRFLQFIPGKDSVKFVIRRNNDSLAIGETYFGNLPSNTSSREFNILIPPGSYDLKLIRRDSLVFTPVTFTFAAGKVYSISARGSIKGTGAYRESFNFMQHN